uniref:MRH domain-containing protein n=1 Tax=Heterosigma akashiwo TaxID=2829 RepID=A0A7S4DKM3_HETAK
MALDGECFEGNFGEFTYEVCPFGQANQGRTRIGKFDRWGEGQHGPEGQTPTMYYTKGQTCHGGLARKAEVVLRCAATSGLVEAEEPEVCSYALTLTTPLACSRQGLATAEARLVALGVDKDKISSSRDHQNGPAVVSQQQQQKSDICSARQQTSSQDADDDEEEPHQFSPSSRSSSSSQKEKNNRGEEL